MWWCGSRTDFEMRVWIAALHIMATVAVEHQLIRDPPIRCATTSSELPPPHYVGDNFCPAVDVGYLRHFGEKYGEPYLVGKKLKFSGPRLPPA